MPATALVGWSNLPDDGHPVWRRLVRAAFTPSQQRVTEVLWAHQGEPLPLSRMMDLVYADHPDPPFDDIIRVHVSRIRKKLPPGWSIRAQGWSGYVLTVP